MENGQTGAKSRLRAIALSLWTAWLLITAGDFLTLDGAGYSDNRNYVPHALLDAATPILFANFNASVRWITLPLTLICLLLADTAGRRILHAGIRAAFNLAVLVGITALIDTAVWKTPVSIHHGKEAYDCTVTKPKPEWCVVSVATSRRPSDK